MKSGFFRMNNSTGDPDPPPGPTPFPIKIVQDDPAPPPSNDNSDSSNAIAGKRNDEFYPAWERFLAVEPKRAKRIDRAAKELQAEKAAAGDGLQVKENAARSWEEAATECRAKVNAIVEECERLNEKYRDQLFDLEAGPNCLQSLNGRYPKAVDNEDPPPWIKRVEDIFDKPEFFIDGANATDIHQGSSGDCWFLAACMAIAAKGNLVDKLCVARNEKVGVYGFVFHRDGEWIHEVIDDKLFLRVGDDDDLAVVRDWDVEKKEGMSIRYDDDKLKEKLQRGGEALYFSHCKSNETWLPLIEKAYAKAHGDYSSIEGGFASEGTEDLTGGVAVHLNPEDIMDKDRFWKEQLLNVNKKYLFGGGSKSTGSKGFIGGHAYAVLQAWEEGDLRLLKLRNPWGDTEWEGDWSDGSKLWTAEMMTKLNHTFGDDGVFWISYKDFLKHFPSINRVRLFDENWSVGQQWTCVSVPWTVDYLDSYFKFTITEKGPVVIVLAQPDDRFFYGLRGRYLYSLHFRVYKEGDDSRYLVRSMHNSGNETVFTRSVSAEVDLEPGTYKVYVKVTATRSTVASTAEENVYKYASERKEKLLHVGRRFDYAQSKGNLKAMEDSIRKEKKLRKREKQIKSFKKGRSLNQQERERARKRRKRVDDAMREKRKAFELKRREKAKERKAKGLKRQNTGSTEAQPTTADSEEKGDRPSQSSEEPVKVEKADAQETEETQPGATNQEETEVKDDKPDTTKPKETEEDQKADDVSQKLSQLSIKAAPGSKASTQGDISPIDEDESEYDSPVEPPEELEDDDFDWDSEIDGPLFSSDEEEEENSKRRSSKSSKNDIFGDDPWNALCVMGLRVYSQCPDVKVKVVKEGEEE